MEYAFLVSLFLKGFLVGIIIAAPVGPIALLCIRRTLSQNYTLGLATGFGAGCADTFFGAIVGFSLASIANLMTKYDFLLRLGGAILLIFVGMNLLFQHQKEMDLPEKSSSNLFVAFISAFFLTLTNPITILAFAAVFAGLGVSHLDESYFYPLLITLGVFLGANGWWLSLCTAVKLMRHKLTEYQLLWINHISAVCLIAFAGYILIPLIFSSF